MVNIIDTHAHLYGEEFEEDIEAVVQRAQESGIGKIFLPNINGDTVAAMLHLCDRWPGFFFPMLGLHPTDLDENYREVLGRMETLLQVSHSHNNYIGIGEVGLDYYWDSTYYNEQQTAFDIQVGWALAYNLPLMIHSRSAHRELVDLLSPYKKKGISGVFHSFGGSADEAEELLAFDNFMLGINGVLTFKKSSLPEVLRRIPLERIVLETDSPYLTPVPYRGKRNESSYVRYTLEKIAEVYGLPVGTVAEQTTKNALKTFPRTL